MATINALAPVAVGRGPETGLATLLGPSRSAVSPSRVAPGAASDLSILTDGDDGGSYFIVIGGLNGSSYTVSPLWADFVMPPEMSGATAVSIRVRAATPAFSLGADPGSYRDWQTFITDTSWNPIATLQGGDTNLTALEFVSQDGFANFDYWYGIVDPATPSDAGDWFEFALNGSTGAAALAALTGGGLRVTVFMDSWNEVDENFQWAYITSLELLVYGDLITPPVSTYIRKSSIRQLQRGGPGGLGGIPRGYGVATSRGSLRRGPGTVR